jgi:hypothetical protein
MDSRSAGIRLVTRLTLPLSFMAPLSRVFRHGTSMPYSNGLTRQGMR